VIRIPTATLSRTRAVGTENQDEEGCVEPVGTRRISLEFFTEPKDKSGRSSEHSSCRIIINSTSGIVQWIMPSLLRVHRQFAGAGKVQSGFTNFGEQYRIQPVS
jgi:hypothetical protein